MRDLESKIYPVNTLAAIVAAMRAEGISADDALAGTGIDLQELNSPTSKISVAQLLAVCRNALALSGDPSFAVRFGRRLHVTTFGIYGYAMLSSPTQRALIELVLKYDRLTAATAKLSFREESESNIGIWTVEPLVVESMERELYQFIVEAYIGTIIALSNDILEHPERMRREVRLTYPYSCHLPAYEELFGCPVLFGQEKNELRIDTTWIDAPTRRSNELTFSIVQKICAETLDQIELNAGISGELRRILFESAGQFPTIEATCRRLRVSPRTLRRKLYSEGTSYGVLINETRVRLAKRYLRETVMTVDEIAYRVGYNHTPSFRRAFQRLTGVTPTDYRRGRDTNVTL